jgi:predicted enzyme related to lactoylglutathione lyase
MATPTLGSILLGTTNPERLRAWYVAALSPEQSDDGFLDFGGVALLIDGRTDVADKNPEPGRVILNFHVDDAHATAAHLNGLGVSWLVEVEDRGVGFFGTLVDPDGNYIQIIQMKDGGAPSQ